MSHTCEPYQVQQEPATVAHHPTVEDRATTRGPRYPRSNKNLPPSHTTQPSKIEQCNVPDIQDPTRTCHHCLCYCISNETIYLAPFRGLIDSDRLPVRLPISFESHRVRPSLQISQTSDLTSYFIYPRSNKNQTPSSMPVYSRSIYDPEAFDERSRPDVVLSVIQQTRSCLVGISTNIPPSVFSPTKARHFLSEPMSNSATELSNRFRKLFDLEQLGGRTTQPLQKVVRSRTTRWWNYLTASESCSVSRNSGLIWRA